MDQAYDLEVKNKKEVVNGHKYIYCNGTLGIPSRGSRDIPLEPSGNYIIKILVGMKHIMELWVMEIQMIFHLT